MTRISSAEYRRLLAKAGDEGTSEKRREAGRQAQANGASWESFIIGCLDLGNWWWRHARPMKDERGNWREPLAGRKGSPDFFAVRGAEAIWIEAKTETAVVKPHQQEWIDRLRAAGQTVYVWRPSDQAEVKAVLLRGSACETRAGST